MDTKVSAAPRKLVMTLKSCGNPDFGQYAPISDRQSVKGASLAEMVKAAEDYREFWALGGGNWIDPVIKESGNAVATISYNGRVWAMDGTEITIA